MSWGGGSPRIWHGAITLGEGAIESVKSLGLEVDEPGSMWSEGSQLKIRQRSGRSFDGVEFDARAPLDAHLKIELAPADEPGQVVTVDLPLQALLGDPLARELDKQGNRLLLHRAPGDALRVEIDREHLVFAPGELFRVRVEPRYLSVEQGAKLRLRVQLLAARTARELWSAQHPFDLSGDAAIPVEIPLPAEEGAYDILLSVLHAGGWSQAVRQPLVWNKPIVERYVQVLVLDPKGPLPSTKSEADLTTAVSLDPINPRWWDTPSRLTQMPKIQRLWKAPLSSGHSEVWRHALGETLRLAPSESGSWEAYTLPILEPGRPHVLEVDYPSDVPQTLGVSILEPDAAGALMPIGLDSGVDVGEEVIGGQAPQWLKHRVIFWPRTNSPLVLLTNRSMRRHAVFGHIRVLAGWDHLPRSPVAAVPRQGQRLLAACFDRPLFCENFGASEKQDSWSGHSLDDWVTFHEGGSRLVEYLHYAGYNGLVLSVVADGSAIYPASGIEPTPRFDKGPLGGGGHDPLRKDALEMLFRMCDREQLQLVPALDFNAPLPELESILRAEGVGSGLAWIGPDGRSLEEVGFIRRAGGARYNLLSPRVQAVMLGVVQDLVARYGHHPAFGGLAVQISSQGYAQLPGPQWGMDDATIERFSQDARVKVPGEGADRFAQRAEYLNGPGRAAWLDWRAEIVHQFYRQMHAIAGGMRRESRLYLAGGNALAGEQWDWQWRPTLTRRTAVSDALLQIGIDPQRYANQNEIVLLRSERVVPSGAEGAWAVSQELLHSPDFDRCYQGLAVPGSLFYHPPQELRLESFDGRSPFRPAYTLLIAQIARSDSQNRRRFVRSLAALDSQVMFDGGWLLPMGQQQTLDSLVASYRRLPAVPFARVDDGDGLATSQPVVCRYATYAGRTYVYLANDSPLEVTVRVPLSAASTCRLEELSGQRSVEPLRQEPQGTVWIAELEPYDLLAVQISQPDVKPGRPQVLLPGSLETALEQRIRELGGRTAALRTPPPLSVLDDHGFELPPAENDVFGGWAITRGDGVLVEPDSSEPHSGSRSARISSTGQVACLVSKPFPAPATGRLSMAVWLRTPDPSRQPPLRLAFEGRLGDQPYYRYAEVGMVNKGGSPAPLAAEWAQYVFPVDDLPLEGLSQIRVRFDLMGPGEVWIDDVQLFDLVFSERERSELAKLVTVAEYQLRNRQVGDCIRLLESYWPRFLERHVPGDSAIGTAAVASRPRPQPSPSPSAAPSSQPVRGMVERWKEMLPERLRF